MSADDARAGSEMLHLIYTGHGIMVSKQQYRSWPDIQQQHHDYITSLGPWSAAEVIDFLQAEYPDLQPSAQEQVSALLAGEPSACVLGFGAETERAVAQVQSNR